MLSVSQPISEIHWRGGYTNYLSGAGKAPVYDFTVSIYASIGGGSQPDIVHPPLVQYDVGGNAGETLAGTFGGVQTYDYAQVLPAPFQATTGVKYWVQIEAWQGTTPQYGWPPDWQAAHPSSPMATGDCNGDGVVNFADINPFVACRASGGCP